MGGDVIGLSRLLTPKDVSALLQVHLSTVYAWAARGDRPHVVLSEGSRRRCIRFDERELARWLRERYYEGRVDRVPSMDHNVRKSGCAVGARERR